MEKNLVKAPLDEKNLSADWLRDDVFCNNFMTMRDHGERRSNHLVGKCEVYDEHNKKCIDYCGYVEVTWYNNDNFISIKVIGVDASEDWVTTRDAIFEHYKKIFKSLEDIESLNDIVVNFNTLEDELIVYFYWSAD